jgi:hypothetical protein
VIASSTPQPLIVVVILKLTGTARHPGRFFCLTSCTPQTHRLSRIMHVHVYRRISSSSAQCPSAFVVISSLSYALPLRPFCPPSPPLLYFFTHASISLSSLDLGCCWFSLVVRREARPAARVYANQSVFLWLLAARSHGTLTLRSPLYIHSRPFPNLRVLILFVCLTHRVHASTTAHGSLSPRVAIVH